MLRAFVFALLLLASAAQAQPVSFASIAAGSSSAGPEIKGRVYEPAGAGPFPAIVLAHSCAGVNDHTAMWGRILSGWGYLVIAPDSFGPRGEKAVCTKPRTITHNMRVADVAGALDFLATRPDVAKGRVGIIGHSHGGSTSMRSVQASYDLAKRGLRGGVAYYPRCEQAFDRDVGLPLLILIGDKDDWTPADRCRQLMPNLARRELVEIVYYPSAFHSFDNKARDRDVPGSAGRMHHLAYDRVAAPDAEARTKSFFERILR